MATDYKRYVVVNYDNQKAEQPKTAFTTNNLQTAEEMFEKSAERKILSTILYDHKTDDVMKIAIQGPPIYLVKAIEFSRGGKLAIEKLQKTVIKGASSATISYIAKSLAGEAVPGVGGAVLAHFSAPYYAIKGDGVNAVKAGAGLWGGMSGAIIGTIVGGPFGAFVGGLVGGMGAGEGAAAIVRLGLPPSKKTCENCEGAGLVLDYRRCPECEGHGYV